MPELFIITGSNGAGKSTVGGSYLPENIQQNYSIFDGDKLFMQKQRELFPATTRSHKEAKKLSGGHYVPPIEVEANFFGNLEKLDQYFTIIDDLTIVDTSETEHVVLAHLVDGTVESSVMYEELPDWFIERLPSIAQKVKDKA